MLTVILGSFVYNNTLNAYVHSRSIWTYIPRNLSLYRMQYNIPGIFETNPYKYSINGSLWTIRYEFFMYILLSLLFFLKNKKNLAKIFLLLSFSLLVIVNTFFLKQMGVFENILSTRALFDLGTFFIGGALLAIFKIDECNPKYLNAILILASIFCIISLVFSCFNFIKFIVLPVMIILFGLKSTSLIDNVKNKIGDLLIWYLLVWLCYSTDSCLLF